ncbi:MAG: hypothetical protein LBR77_10555 [Lachnospiraceae bacterium]|jgi:ASC-1-like (ASCH) protein|nr:hypothetical protein [Lachnospiraceae bacterium]
MVRLHLNPRYYDYLKNGTKCIDARMYDEKRKTIGLGNTVEFFTDSGETTPVTVTGLLRYRDFASLVADFDSAMLNDASMTKEEILADLNKYNAIEKQEQCGFEALGIRFVK